VATKPNLNQPTVFLANLSKCRCSLVLLANRPRANHRMEAIPRKCNLKHQLALVAQTSLKCKTLLDREVPQVRGRCSLQMEAGHLINHKCKTLLDREVPQVRGRCSLKMEVGHLINHKCKTLLDREVPQVRGRCSLKMEVGHLINLKCKTLLDREVPQVRVRCNKQRVVNHRNLRCSHCVKNI
jgi:hypothetical protein